LPSFIPGFTASVDYYKIDMGNALSQFAIQDVVNNCANGSALFCSGITRNPTTGQITKVLASTFNAASLKVSGVDFEASYVLSLDTLFDGWDATFTVSNLTSYAEHITTIVNGVSQENAGYLTGNNSLPHWRSSTSFVYTEGPLTARVLMYYIGPGFYAPNMDTPAVISPYHWSGRTYFDRLPDNLVGRLLQPIEGGPDLSFYLPSVDCSRERQAREREVLARQRQCGVPCSE